jgi:hypothetical protein
VADQKNSPNLRWIKFTGESVDRWGTIIDELDLKQIPLNLIDEIALRAHNGQDVIIRIADFADYQDDDLGQMIDNTINQNRNNLKAVEFLVNFDRLEQVIFNNISGMFGNEN